MENVLKSLDGQKCHYVTDIGDCSFNRECSTIYSNYKPVCGQVWNAQCDKLNPQEKRQVVEKAHECIKGRQEFSLKCCNNRIDKGHCGAIIKMRDIIYNCSHDVKPAKPLMITPIIKEKIASLLKTPVMQEMVKGGWKFSAIINDRNDSRYFYLENAHPTFFVTDIPDTDKYLVMKHS